MRCLRKLHVREFCRRVQRELCTVPDTAALAAAVVLAPAAVVAAAAVVPVVVRAAREAPAEASAIDTATEASVD